MEVAQALALEQFGKYDRARLEREAAADAEFECTAKRLTKQATKPKRAVKCRRR